MPNWDSFRAIWQAEAQPPTPPSAIEMLAQANKIAVDWEEIRRRSPKKLAGKLFSDGASNAARGMRTQRAPLARG
jgi:hypothetical protein